MILLWARENVEGIFGDNLGEGNCESKLLKENHSQNGETNSWARLDGGVSKQGVTIFAWRPGSQYDVAATRGADNVLTSDCRAQFGRPSTWRGCRICVTVRLPVRPRGETMYWQANVNTPLSFTPV